MHAPGRELDELRLRFLDMESNLLEPRALQPAQHLIAALAAAGVWAGDVHGSILTAPAELLLEAIEPATLAGCVAAGSVHVDRVPLPAEGTGRELVTEFGPAAVLVDVLRKFIGLRDLKDQALADF